MQYRIYHTEDNCYQLLGLVLLGMKWHILYCRKQDNMIHYRKYIVLHLMQSTSCIQLYSFGSLSILCIGQMDSYSHRILMLPYPIERRIQLYMLCN